MTSYIHTLLAFPFIQQFFCSSMMPTFNFLAQNQIKCKVRNMQKEWQSNLMAYQIVITIRVLLISF